MNDMSSLQGLFEAAQRIQSEMARVKAELGTRTVSAETGGGLVQCTVNGKGEVVSLQIDPTLLAADSAQMLTDLTVGAVNLALERARQLAAEEIARASGGLPLPPGLFGG
jgi:DNA-binding YbaB/EbfC family protein